MQQMEDKKQSKKNNQWLLGQQFHQPPRRLED